jgi:hypothetical protein
MFSALFSLNQSDRRFVGKAQRWSAGPLQAKADCFSVKKRKKKK